MPVTQGQIIDTLEHTLGSSEAIRFECRNLGLSVQCAGLRLQEAVCELRFEGQKYDRRRWLVDGDQVEIFDTHLTLPLGKYRHLQR